ncbi:hypothetical protein VB712_14290 [Spirulina sp. CCNP1310]|uniref:hypothetical protein n=1 Tax=Spirulina sp. CCNP1310 TaxID=3110249 RepID=UPI002B20EB74|nr:hypothetical protein [Spirulina sp. CCNP1310]MEA5420397.1 hypothetical protein [Spirulina sp. CCNP1310]
MGDRRHHPLALLFCTLLIAGSLTACGESKAVQCDRLMGAVRNLQATQNRLDQEMQTAEAFEEAATFDDFKLVAAQMSEAFAAIATSLATDLEVIAELKLRDSELRTLQTEVVNQGSRHRDLPQWASGVLAEVSELELNAEGRIKLDQLATEIDQFSVDLEKAELAFNETVGNVQVYCGGPVPTPAPEPPRG